jgi:hypothetical protein
MIHIFRLLRKWLIRDAETLNRNRYGENKNRFDRSCSELLVSGVIFQFLYLNYPSPSSSSSPSPASVSSVEPVPGVVVVVEPAAPPVLYKG